LILKRRYLRRF